jgi:ribosomal-protein-alanine N-acetyltransferase
MLIKHIVELTNKHIMLEVNENNKPAINFYKKNGFKIISVRKDYYGSNQNAIIMTLNKKCD